MQKFVISGGLPLSGEVRIAGAKNAVLKMMAAAALTPEPVTLRNAPNISDVAILSEVMNDIGFAATGNIQRFIEATDGLEVYTGRKGSPNANFPLATGEAYFVNMIATTPYIVVGSDDPAITYQLNATQAGVSRSRSSAPCARFATASGAEC